MTSTLWDCVIVGAGPAGLSAAVYMGRFRRRTLVVDGGDGRWSYGQRNENYLGFPRGVGARRLHALGKAQAERFGVSFESGRVTRVRQAEEGYALLMADGEHRARTVIWAAGVRDHWPAFSGARRLVGKRLFWCIVCDGWRTLGRRILVFADTADCEGTVLQFLTYTRDITVLTDPDKGEAGPWLQALEAGGVPAIAGRVERVDVPEEDEAPLVVRLESGQALEADYLFSLLGSTPRIEALEELPLKLSPAGHIRIDDKNHTSLSGFFAAGDVSDKHSHQVVSAAHEGAMAAQAANHVLY